MPLSKNSNCFHRRAVHPGDHQTSPVAGQLFDAGLFADPAWDILLDLMAAGLEGRNVSVPSLCIAAAVPPTTALRWITSMTESGMLLREQGPNDARRVFIILSDEVAAKLDDYFAAAAVQKPQII